jgi:hypothetical protein
MEEEYVVGEKYDIINAIKTYDLYLVEKYLMLYDYKNVKDLENILRASMSDVYFFQSLVYILAKFGYPWNDLMFIDQDEIRMDKNRYNFLQNNQKYLTNQLKMNNLMFPQFRPSYADDSDFEFGDKNTFCVIC